MVQLTTKTPSKLPIRQDKLDTQHIEAVDQLMVAQIQKIHVESGISAYKDCLIHLENSQYNDWRAPYKFLWVFRSESVGHKRDREIKKIRGILFKYEMHLEDLRSQIDSLKAKIKMLRSYLDIAEAESQSNHTRSKAESLATSWSYPRRAKATEIKENHDLDPMGQVFQTPPRNHADSVAENLHPNVGFAK